MAEKPLMVETLSELQIWIGGKFELIAQAQNTTHSDLTNVRSRLHDLANEMTKITALNLPEKLNKLELADKEHQQNIERFVREASERRGAMNTLKTLYVFIGAVIGGAITLAFKVYDIIGSQ